MLLKLIGNTLGQRRYRLADLVGYLLAGDVDLMLLGQHWPNNQNVVQPTLFDDIGPTLGQFSYAGWVDRWIRE